MVQDITGKMTDQANLNRIHVAVGVIYGADGRILVTRRAAGQHLGGMWEFPGGKVDPGETVNDALTRELWEELAIRPQTQLPLCRIVHNYPDKAVLLDVWKVTRFSGEPDPQEGQPLRWLDVQELDPDDFPQANRAIIRCLHLPDCLAIFQIPDAEELEAEETEKLRAVIARAPTGSLIRIRQNSPYAGYPHMAHGLIDVCTDICKSHKAGFILDLHTCDPVTIDHLSITPDLKNLIRGWHVNSSVLWQLRSRPVPDHLLFGASCHTLEDIRKAEALGADYLLVSPVKSTPSNPGAKTLGWQGLKEMSEKTHTAIYALGGMTHTDLETAQASGARGIAGVRMFATD
jgi:8-oxo-dGTP diphosphatase